MPTEPNPSGSSRYVVDQPGGNLLLDLFVLDQRLNAMLKVALAGSQATPAQYAVYAQLGRGSSAPGELADVLGLSPATLTGYLVALESRGHLTRSRSPHDGRSFTLALTEAGEQTRAACAYSIREVVRRLDRVLGGSRVRNEMRRSLGTLGEAIDDVRRSLPT